MNPVSPKKLLNSKWTRVNPVNKEKHFTITNVEFNDYGKVILCEIQAVLTLSIREIDWRELKNSQHWRQGWC